MPCINEQGKKIYCDSYKDVVQQLTILQPLLTAHDVRMKAARIFRPRYKIDKASEKTEIARPGEYEGIPFTITPDGDVYFPTYGPEGKTLDEIHLSQLRQRPQEYSLRDHQTSRLIQRTFQQGATKVVTVYGREGSNNRDILEMTYDQISGRGVMKIKNTSENDKLHNFSKIQSIAKQTFPHLAEVKPINDVFVLTDKPFTVDKAKKITHTVEVFVSLNQMVTKHAMLDKPLEASLSHYNVSKQRSGRVGESTQPQVHLGKDRNEVSQVTPMIERRFSASRSLLNKTEGVTQKVGRDTKNSLVLLGVWVAEVWRKRKKPQKEADNHKNVSQVSTASQETFFIRLRKRLFTKKIETHILKKERNGLEKRLINVRQKIKEKVVMLKNILGSVKEKMVTGFQKIKREIVKPVTTILHKLSEQVRVARRIVEKPKDTIRKVMRKAQEMAVQFKVKTKKIVETFFIFSLRRILKKVKVLQRLHSKERQKTSLFEQTRKEQRTFSKLKRRFVELRQSFIIAREKKKTVRSLSIDFIFSRLARVSKKIEAPGFNLQVFRFSRLRIVGQKVKSKEQFYKKPEKAPSFRFKTFLGQLFFMKRDNENTKKWKSAFLLKSIIDAVTLQEFTRKIVLLPILKSRRAKLNLFSNWFWRWLVRSGVFKIERSVAVKFGQPFQGKPSQKVVTRMVYQQQISPQKGSVVVG